VSSRNDRFECRWQRSNALLTAYLGAQSLALISIFLLEIPVPARVLGLLLCLLHGIVCWRRDGTGWQIWNRRSGWQPVQLRPDSIALPHIVVLRFRLMTGHRLHRRWIRSVCIPGDAMAPDLHRRLRLRLKFSRRRWAAPE
jgi:toxin CptA